MELRETLFFFLQGHNIVLYHRREKWNTKPWEGPLWTGSGEVKRAVFPHNSIFPPVNENILRPCKG
jgi:hypothetical protein